MAKAVVPFAAFQKKFRVLASDSITSRLQELVSQFLHDHAPADRTSEPVRP